MTGLAWIFLALWIASMCLLALQAASLERLSQRNKVLTLKVERYEEGTEGEDIEEDIHVFVDEGQTRDFTEWEAQRTIGNEHWRAP